MKCIDNKTVPWIPRVGSLVLLKL